MTAECDKEVFAEGVSLLAIDGWAKDIEPWVQKVATHSGQRVDWHYSGGVAHVLVLGDHAKAMASVDALADQLVWVDSEEPRFSEERMNPVRRRNPRIMSRYASAEPGLYRAGVTDAPKGAIGAITTSGAVAWIKGVLLPGGGGT